MGAITMRLRGELRARWRAWAVVAALIGLAGGVVLTTAAGARRTGSAYARLLRASRSADALVSPNDTGFPGYYGALARRTHAEVTPVIGYGVTPTDRADLPFLMVASPDPHWGTSVERPKITEGRTIRPGAADEVVADVTAARMLHLHAGSRLRIRVAARDEELPDPATDPAVTVRVVGVGVTRDSVVPVNALATAPLLLSGPAFAARFGPDHYAFDGAYVQLAPGTSMAALRTTAQRLSRDYPQTGGGVLVADEAQQAAKVEHAIRPQAVALALFAALTALTALIAIGEVVTRRLALSSTANDTLRALGMTRRQRFAIGLAQVGGVAVVGGALAVVVAVAASATMPIGPARVAEPDPGVAFDGLVLGGGFVLIVALLLAAAAWPAWRGARAAARSADSGPPARGPSRLTRWATASGAPPPVAIGVGYAVDPGRGRTAVPVRSGIVVTALAVTAVAAALTFGSNLSRLVGTPRLYGQAWDVTADGQFSELPVAQIDSILRRDPGVSAWTFGAHNDIDVAGRPVPAIELSRAEGPLLAPSRIDGRAARGPREIALGTTTLERLHRKVGQTVVVDFPLAGTRHATRATIVGTSVFPFFGQGSFTPTGLGVGAQMAGAGEAQADAGVPANFVLVKVQAGSSHDVQVARVVRDLGGAPVCGPANQCTVSTAIRPTDVLNYSRVQSTPVALAAVLAVLGIAVITNLLVTSVRRRRRDLAVLKTLGFERRQVSAAVAWQATTLVLVAVLIGLPVGAVLGGWVWAIFAGNLGIPAAPRVPAAGLLLVLPAAVVLANAIAAVPALFAGRAKPATALRAE